MFKDLEDVIQGSKNIINKYKPTIIFEHDDQYFNEPNKTNTLENFY